MSSRYPVAWRGWLTTRLIGEPSSSRTQIVRNRSYGLGMDIILIPGLWLNASTWDAVVPYLEAAGR